jgi:hypothetical protein
MKAINKLVSELKKKEGANFIDVYNPKKEESFYYYYSIDGFINDDYFLLYIMKFKTSKNVKLECTCDNKKLEKEIIKPFLELNLN